MAEQNQQNAQGKPIAHQAGANPQAQPQSSGIKPGNQMQNSQPQGAPAKPPQGGSQPQPHGSIGPNQQGRPQGSTQPQAGQQPKPQAAPTASQGKPQFQGKPAAPTIKKDENPNFRGIVRIVGKDLDGHFNIYKALLRVRGVGATLARTLEKVIIRELKISKKTRVGDLTEEQINKVDEIVKNPAAHGIKTFMLNRQRDRDSGKNLHLLMNDLGFAQKQDVQLEKDTKSYKGWRFSLGQRVRGQHNRTTGRSGFTVGVMKKAIKEQKAAAAASAQDKGKAGEKKK